MIIKHIPEDFIVQEVLVADYSPEPEGRETLLFQLDKKGYSTFGAIQMIEEWFGIKDCESAGLKDSDGVTSQKISVPIRYQDMIDRLEAFNHETCTEKTFIHLSFLGYAAEPIKAARLEGNAFRLRLRNMDNALAQSWLECQIYTLLFPNYFDKQRFGVPGYKKVNHLLGEALYNKDYKAAYEYLIQGGTKEANLPFNGDHKAFFKQIDPRIRGFYDSALYSMDFNERLGDILEECGEVVTVEDEGIIFRMPRTKNTMAALIAEEFPEKRMGTFRIKTLEQEVPRKLIVTANVNFLSCAEDEYYPGRSALTVSFFLPMGAYATMAMKQLDIFLAKD